MPKESLNVYLAAVDGMSPVLASITDKTRALDKESQELQQTYEALNKANKTLIHQKAELEKQLQAVNKEVKEAKAQLKELGDEANSDAYEEAQEKQRKLKDEIAATTKALQENQKIYKENIETIRKGNVEAQGIGLSDIANGMFAGQIGQMFSSSLGGLGQSLLTSAVGTSEAALVSDTLSGIISGGAAGAAFGPWGIAAGAALGGLSGLISGNTKIFEAKDDAFKEYYGGLYEDVNARSGEMVESGSTIAGGREQTRMALSQRFGSEQGALDYLAEVEEMAARTNYDYDEIVGYTKLLLNSYKAKTEANEDGTKETDVLDVLMALSDATAGLDLSSSDVNMMISGLSRMRTTGKATQEYLNYFRERGVDTDQALADALTESTGKTVNKSSIADMVHAGNISGEFAAQAILEFIQKEFGGLSDTLAGTYDAMVDNLGDIESSLKAQGGDAYNELRKEGVQAEMDALGGELGEAIGEINRIMGENQARRENLQDQYMREVLDAVLTGNQGSLWSTFTQEQRDKLTEMSEQYATLMEQYREGDTDAGAEIEALYEVAQGLGQAYFDNSDEVARLNEVEKDQVEAIRLNTEGLEGATMASYLLSLELSKGITVRGVGFSYDAPAAPAISQIEDAESTLASWRADPDSVSPEDISAAQAALADAAAAARRNAFGLKRVPYDDYPALLHEGERVLTASEARAQDAGAGSPISVTITGNSFTGTPEEMADQLAQIILRKLSQAAQAAAPR